MPELPDIELYREALRPRVLGRRLVGVRVRSLFLVRTVEPPPDAAVGRRVASLERLGKRVVIGFEGGVFFVIHLMIAGRLLWRGPGARAAGKIDLAAFEFRGAGGGENGEAGGTLVLTEAGTKRRASLHVVQGREALAALDPGGIEPLECTAAEFAAALRRENRTLKRALTDPRLFAGIGNAYSDEILFDAKLSPIALTGSLDAAAVARLHAATRRTLTHWIGRLRDEFGLAADGSRPGRFPGVGQVTAFRPDFRVHGRFGEPCTVCGAPIQRIVRAQNEVNYCPGCQTGGRVLADRSLSRLLKDDWPRTVEEWEAMQG